MMGDPVDVLGAPDDVGECTLADIEAWTGVVVDRTGDYRAGRTVIHHSTDDFLEFLISQMHDD